MCMGEATARCPGSCGELVEGALDGRDFLITCPINLYSYVNVKILYNNDQIIGSPECSKTLKAIKKLFDYMDIQGVGACISINSQIPSGLGMASSTADITAACIAASVALGEELSPNEIADIALSVEPSDGVMYKGIVFIDFIRGTIKEYIGMPPSMDIFIIDLGGKVETVNFYKNKIDLENANKKKEPYIREAVSLVKEGIYLKDVSLIGKGAVISARANQELLYKPELEEIIRVAKELGAVGVNTAHSGTVVGIMFPEGLTNTGHVENVIRSRVNNIKRCFTAKITGEGPQVMREGCYYAFG
jgi:L-threonine kinase